jgi:hypothetical protein
MEKFKLVTWEATKVVIIVTCIVILCANMFFLAKFNEIDRGIDVVYSDMHDQHLELLNKIK